MARRSDEMKIFGLNAVLAVAERRIEDIIRVYLLEERIPELSALLKYCAEQRRAYHVVPRAELDKIADSVHHEGVCVLALRRPPLRFGALVKDLARARGPRAVVLLEDVKNPHNVGAIVRTAAHFGVRALLLPDETQADRPPPALVRTAEGGLESVELVAIDDPARAVEALAREGFRTLATSSRVRDSIYRWRPPERVLVLFGSESEGLSKKLFALADDIVAIPGTGAVESLNVAAAAAVVLSEINRARVEADAAPRLRPRGKSRR